MKLALLLHIPDTNPEHKKMKVKELAALEKKLLQDQFAGFREAVKDNKNITIVEELNTPLRSGDLIEPWVIVEMADTYKENAYHYFRGIKQVKTIDFILPHTKPEEPDSQPPTGKRTLTIADLTKLTK